MMKRQRLFTAVPRTEWNDLITQGHIASEPTRTAIDPHTGAITTRPAGRVWWTDRRHADQVYRTENNYEGELRIIGVRRNLMPEHPELASGQGWRCFVTQDPVSLQDVEITDWRIE